MSGSHNSVLLNPVFLPPRSPLFMAHWLHLKLDSALHSQFSSGWAHAGPLYALLSPMAAPYRHLCGGGDSSLNCFQSSTPLNLWLQKWVRFVCVFMRIVHVYKPMRPPYHPSTHSCLFLSLRWGSHVPYGFMIKIAKSGVCTLHTLKERNSGCKKTLDWNDRLYEMVLSEHIT